MNLNVCSSPALRDESPFSSRFTLPTGQTQGLMRTRAGWVAQLVEQRTEKSILSVFITFLFIT
jgi:hypothetical protein